jgi:hypothetical protein
MGSLAPALIAGVLRCAPWKQKTRRTGAAGGRGRLKVLKLIGLFGYYRPQVLSSTF